MSKKVTKGAIAEFVRNQLKQNEKWALNAMLKIYEYQTADEQAKGCTCKYNGVGFSGAHSEIMSSLSEQYLRKGWMSPKQMKIVMKTMYHYTRQIIQVSNQEKLVQMVIKNRK